MIASCGFLEDDLRQCSKEEGVTMADSVETHGVDLRTSVGRLGANGKAREKKCKVRFSIIKKNKAFQKNCMKVGVKKLLRAGHGASKDVESSCSGKAPTERFKIEEADGSSSGQKEHELSVFVHGSLCPTSGRKALYCGCANLGRRSMDRKMAHGTKRRMAESDS